MADTGAPYFIPYVEPTDLVRDYPAANEAMALAIVAALEDIPVTIKKVDAFTGDGTFVVPAGVTYAIAHMLGGGGGIGFGNSGLDGGSSSVAFASGTVTSNGGRKANGYGTGLNNVANNALPNTGRGGNTGRNSDTSFFAAGDSTYVVAGAAVTPGASITVIVGAGAPGDAFTGGGGSGYVYIEYFEEV